MRPIEPDPFQGLIDFFEGFFAEIGNGQQILRPALEQIPDRQYPMFLQAIGGADREADFGNTHVQFFFHILLGQFCPIQRNSCAHGFSSVIKGSVEK